MQGGFKFVRLHYDAGHTFEGAGGHSGGKDEEDDNIMSTLVYDTRIYNRRGNSTFSQAAIPHHIQVIMFVVHWPTPHHITSHHTQPSRRQHKPRTPPICHAPSSDITAYSS